MRIGSIQLALHLEYVELGSDLVTAQLPYYHGDAGNRPTGCKIFSDPFLEKRELGHRFSVEICTNAIRTGAYMIIIVRGVNALINADEFVQSRSSISIVATWLIYKISAIE